MTFCSRNLFIFVIATIVSACSFKASEQGNVKDPLHASFQMGQLTAVTVDATASDPIFGMPIRKMYHLRGRVMDRATATPRVGERFTLWRGAQSQLLDPADAEGYIYWEEVFTYLPLAPENLITVARRLEGAAGEEWVRFAINPWADGSNIIDLNHGENLKEGKLVPENDIALALAGREKYRPANNTPESGTNLFVERLDVTLGEAVKAKTRSLEASFQVSALRKKKEAGFAKLTLPGGKFRIAIKFLQEGREAPTPRQWAEVKGVDAEARQGKISFTTELPLTEIPEGNTQLKLHYHLEPISDDIGLLAAQGELLLPARTGHMGGVPVEKPLSYEVRVSMDPPRGNYHGITPKIWQVEHGGKPELDLKHWAATARVESQLCLIDSLSRLPLQYKDFQATLAETTDGGGAEWRDVTTDEDGCVRWSNPLTYSLVEESKFLDRFLVVRGTKAPFQNEKVAVAVSLDPWFPQFFYWNRERKGAPPEQPSPRVPYLVAKDMSFTYNNPLFEITPHLQLVTHHRYHGTLQPQIYRPSRRDGSTENEKLHHGMKLRLRGLLLHPLFVDKNRGGGKVAKPFVSAFSTVGTVDEMGLLQFDFSLPIEFTRQPLVDTRIEVLVVIAPEGEDAPAVSSPPYIGPIKVPAGQSDKSDTPYRKNEYNLAEFEAMWKTMTETSVAYDRGKGEHSYASYDQWKKSPLELWEDYWTPLSPVKKVELSSSPPKGWTGIKEWMKTSAVPLEELDVLTPDGERAGLVLKQFCGLLKADQSKCEQSPKNFFHWSTMDVIESVPNGWVKPALVSSPLLTASITFFRETLETEKKMKGDRDVTEHAVNFTGKVGMGALENGISGSKSVIYQDEEYTQHEAGVSNDLKARVQRQEQQNLNAERKEFKFKANVRRCATIRPLASLVVANGPVGVFIFCSPVIERTVHESWYYIWDQWRQQSSSHVDPRDPWQRGWMKMVRGEGNFEALKAELDRRPLYFVSKKVEPFKGGVDRLIESALRSSDGNRYHADGGNFTGFLAFTETSPFYWNDNQIEHYVSGCAGKEPLPSEKAKHRYWEAKRLYCRCYYEEPARLVAHQKFLDERSDVLKTLTQLDIGNRCAKVANKELQ